MRHLVLCCVLLLPLSSRADSASDPTVPVRGYFEALGKNDFKRALSLTAGAAQARTAHMVGTLKRQAAAAGAHVELKVKQVRVQTAQRMAEGLPVPVDVQFDIDVIGKKWIFSKVAKKLAGRAQFLVAGSSRIVGIEGNIE